MFTYKQEKPGHKTRLTLIIIEEQIFKNAKHSVQNNLSLILNANKSINTINSNDGINNVPEIIFQITDNTQVTLAPAICGILSCPRYFGHNPTSIKATTDKKGRNQKYIGLISTHAGKVRKDIAIIHIVKIFPFYNKQQLYEIQSGLYLILI